MRIALRTSGGRGEYELTGEHGGVAASDLFDHRLLFHISPQLVLDGRQRPRRLQGKPRIRLEDGGRHAYALLADVLLLPVPRRELRLAASGADFVRDGGYAITDIDVDVASHNGSAELRPTRLWLRNSEEGVRSIEFAERMAAVQAVWGAARDRDGRLAGLVREHERAVETGSDAGLRSSARALRSEFGTGADVLPLLAIGLNAGIHDLPEGGTVADAIPDEGAEERDPAEAVRDALTRWRRQAVRDAAGRRFAESVKAAYDYTCVVSGHRYSKLDHATTSGVDGAHILPYRRYDLNEVINGLCLCKTCHWAFDNGIVRLDYRRTARRYVVSIPRTVRADARANAFDLSFFEQYEGAVARSLLPQAETLWPSANYLDELNAQLFAA